MENRTDNKAQSVFSKAIKAGKKRTYFFDVRTTKSNDYFLTITESRRKPSGDGYDKNKLFLYKEDFNKFLVAMQETIDHVKTELLPDYDFASFDREHEEDNNGYNSESRGGYGESKRYTSQVGDSADESLARKSSEDDDKGYSSSLFNEDGEKW